jgi:hypothetical protein
VVRYAKWCLHEKGKLEFKVYSTKERDHQQEGLDAVLQEYAASYIFAGPNALKEVSDFQIIRDCYDAISTREDSNKIHIIVLSSDKDFHNLFADLQSFHCVTTHSLSEQAGSALTSRAMFALEVDEVPTLEHAASPSRKRKTPLFTKRYQEKIEKDDDDYDYDVEDDDQEENTEITSSIILRHAKRRNLKHLIMKMVNKFFT